MEHIGHWYDRQHIGMVPSILIASCLTTTVRAYAPGYYWHAVDAVVPLSGQPNRFAYFDPRSLGHGDTWGPATLWFEADGVLTASSPRLMTSRIHW